MIYCILGKLVEFRFGESRLEAAVLHISFKNDKVFVYVCPMENH